MPCSVLRAAVDRVAVDRVANIVSERQMRRLDTQRARRTVRFERLLKLRAVPGRLYNRGSS